MSTVVQITALRRRYKTITTWWGMSDNEFFNTVLAGHGLAGDLIAGHRARRRLRV